MIKKKSIQQSFRSILQKIMGGDEKILVNHVNVRPTKRDTQDIAKWRNAIMQAEGHTQQRSKLLDLYKDMLLDGHLESVIGRRVKRITNKPLVFVKEDGTVVDEVSDLSKKTFFHDLLCFIIEQKFYGHSLIEILWPPMGKDQSSAKTKLIPRKHVKPRWGIVTEQEWGLEGVDYREDPFKDHVIEVGDPEDLGLLMGVAQYVIYKRGNFGDWSEFNEVFGMPFRWATYNNETSRKVLEQALEQAGSAGYVVAPEDANLQYLNGNISGNGSDAFRFLREACNEEISLKILGVTMTSTEARSSGYAQSKTHQEAEDEVTQDDRLFALRYLNEKLIPILERLGYPVQGGEWQYLEKEKLTLAQRIEIDLKVASKVPVGESYWYETYGIPKPEADELPDPDEPAPNEPKEEKEEPDEKKKRSRSARLAAFYDLHADGCDCDSCANFTDLPAANFRKISSKLEKQVADNIYQGNYDLNPELHRQYYSRLRKFARVGFSRSLSKASDWDDFTLQQGIKRNLSEFAAVKQHSLIQELRAIANKPVSEYQRAAKAIVSRYNSTYLNAELLTFEAAAHSAGQWRDFLDRADLYPNLKFSTVGDDRVRTTHRALDGATYPVNDPFWDTHTPPLDWRCRCVVIQTDAPISNKAAQQVRPGFGTNPYKAKALISRNHPYFSMPQQELNTLLEIAEELRAQIERADVMKRAAQQGIVTIQNKPAQLTAQDARAIADSDSDQMGVRNSLLTALSLLADQLTPGGIRGDTYIYQLTLLGTTFELQFIEQESGLLLREIVAL
jgi:SPP1 gp7 family putative phage head morphogenesis protein